MIICCCFVLLYDNDGTGKYLSEALILVSTNPQYDYRLFIELRVQYMKIPSSEHVENMHLIHETSLLSTPLPLWTCIITLGKLNDDEEHCF